MKRKLLLSIIAILVCTACKKEANNLSTIAFTKKRSTHLSTPTVINYPVISASASSSTNGLPPSNAYDGSVGTFWSSLTHAKNASESFQFFISGNQIVNYITLTPRFAGGPALGYPVTYTVYYSTGGGWAQCYQYVASPIPTNTNNHSFPVILPLPAQVTTNGFQITATILGKDNVNNYVFQLAEVGAGYNSDFQHLQFVGNDGTSLVNRMNNAGSGSFDPSKISNLTEDERYPLIYAAAGTYRNIYAPSIVNNGGTAWNIYFGGWDLGTSQTTDRIFVSVSHDDFMNFDAHTLMVTDGSQMQQVNNPSVLKTGSSSWLMYDTNLPIGSSNNKTGYETSPDGITWTPSAASSSYFLNMTGYTGWSNANVNGSNVLYIDNNGLYHLYFTDFNFFAYLTNHATSTDGINYTYVGYTNTNDSYIATDMKAFTFNSTNYYLLGSHINTSYTRLSVSTGLNTFPNSTQFFTTNGSTDTYITSLGFVTANNRLYGALYGASSTSDLKHNSIYAYWLTKTITFVSDETGNTWGGTGNAEKSHGPNQVVMPMGNSFTTGRYYVYDTDGTTLLFVSPQVTVRSGDVWSYVN